MLDQILKNKETIFFGYGRTALEFGYKYLNLNAGDEILYPGYICDVVVLPAHKLGLKIKYYKIKDNLEPDFESLGKLVNEKTKALLAVNYFGFPQPFDKIRQFCREHNLFFIEDNAHSFLSQSRGKYLGSFGDISVLSFRKLIPLVNGAALIINSNLDEERVGQIKEKTSVLGSEGNSLIRFKRQIQRWCKKNNINYLKLRGASSPIPRPGQTQEEDLPFTIDKSTLSVLGKYDFETERERRRSNYEKIISSVDKDLVPVFSSLPAGVVPMVCPFYTRERDKWLNYFKEKKIRAHTWPTLPKEVSENCPKDLDRWKKLIAFAVSF